MKSDIPSAFFDTFSKLEEIPVQTRIAQIDDIYFEYVEKYKIEVGRGMGDTSNPFLLELVDYRNKTVKILESLEK